MLKSFQSLLIEDSSNHFLLSEKAWVNVQPNDTDISYSRPRDSQLGIGHIPADPVKQKWFENDIQSRFPKLELDSIHHEDPSNRKFLSSAHVVDAAFIGARREVAKHFTGIQDYNVNKYLDHLDDLHAAYHHVANHPDYQGLPLHDSAKHIMATALHSHISDGYRHFDTAGFIPDKTHVHVIRTGVDDSDHVWAVEAAAAHLGKEFSAVNTPRKLNKLVGFVKGHLDAEYDAHHNYEPPVRQEVTPRRPPGPPPIAPTMRDSRLAVIANRSKGPMTNPDVDLMSNQTRERLKDSVLYTASIKRKKGDLTLKNAGKAIKTMASGPFKLL